MISVVIPAYNVEKYISNTLDSLNRQTRTDFEIVVVNDGSTDNTEQIINEVLNQSPISKIQIINQANAGVSAARNRGIKESIGEYLFFLDGDDYVDSALIEKIYNRIETEHVDIICWGYDMVNPSKEVIIDYFSKYKHLLEEMAGIEAIHNIIVDKSLWLATGSFVVRKQLLMKYELRYMEGCANGEDQEFVYKVLANADVVMFIDEILSFYVVRRGSISHSQDLRKFDAVQAIKRTYDYFITIDNLQLLEIAQVLKKQHMITTYVRNLQACLVHSQHKNIQRIYRELDEKYPNLMEEMNKEMRINKSSIQGELELFKYKRYYFLLNYWLMLKNREIPIAEFFLKKSYNEIAIYGMGELGYRLYEELKDTGVCVKYAIDKGLASSDTRIKFVDLNQSLESVDVVVVTAFFAFDEIKEQLVNKVSCSLISLEEVVFDFII